MSWSISDVEDKLLNGKVASIAMAPAKVLEAIRRVEQELGPDWIASTASSKGLAPTMDIVGTGLRLGCLAGVAGADKLVDQLRRRDLSADAELTAIYVFRSYDPAASVELYPEIGARRADFRVRRNSDEWTTVEVTQALPSKEQERVGGILRRITDPLRDIDVQCVLEIQFRREPTNEEVDGLSARLPEFCRLPGQQNAELVEGLGYLFRDEFEIGWLRFHEIPELADTAMIGLAMFQGGGPGGGPHHQVAVRIPFSDTRAERFLTDESRQLPKEGPGLVMISGPSSRNQLRVWEELVRRRFQPKMHTRVSGVCLFAGGMMPVDKRYDWLVRTHLVVNGYAKTALPDWVCGAIRSRGDDS
jgi:hypothetical protein